MSPPSHRVGSISEELINFDPWSCWLLSVTGTQENLRTAEAGITDRKWKNKIKSSEERTKDKVFKNVRMSLLSCSGLNYI